MSDLGVMSANVRGPGAQLMRFDPSDRQSVLQHAELLVGRTAAGIASESPEPWDPNTSKGSVGLLIERHFGLEPNSDAGPDLVESGIEIKTVPMRQGQRAVRSKERTSITMIDFHRIAQEPFEGTGLDLKTRLTLYVFFLWSSADIALDVDRRIQKVMLHDRNDLDLVALNEAYSHVQQVTQEGRAHLLSEGDTSPVGACTKGAKGGRRTQPHSDVPARPRAFAWRPAYTTHLYHSHPTELPRLPEITAVDELIARVEQRLLPLAGHSVEDLRARFATSVNPSAKNVGSATFRRILSGGEENITAALETLGVTVRVTRVDPLTLRPREAISFSPFDFIEVAETPWDESDVLATLGRILFIVLDAPRGSNVGEARLRNVIMWSADSGTISTMAHEYEMFRRALREAEPRDWLRSSATEVLHVRPHGRDSRDVVPLPGGGTHVRSSLWLNQAFVQDVIVQHGN